jgi:hypothetical protein
MVRNRTPLKKAAGSFTSIKKPKRRRLDAIDWKAWKDILILFISEIPNF